MRNEPFVSFKPALHFRVFVRAVVVHHHMQLDLAGKLRIQALQKLQKFLMAMARITF